MADIILKVDTGVMKDQANQVMTDVRNIEKHWNSIGKLINNSRNYWEGEASDAHIKIFREVEGDIDKIIQTLKQEHIKLQQMAGIYEDADTKAEQQSQPLQTEIF